MNLLSAGAVGGALTAVAAIANAKGYPLLGAFLSDPNTAAAATSVLVGFGALLSGALAGVNHKPAA